MKYWISPFIPSQPLIFISINLNSFCLFDKFYFFFVNKLSCLSNLLNTHSVITILTCAQSVSKFAISTNLIEATEPVAANIIFGF